MVAGSCLLAVTCLVGWLLVVTGLVVGCSLVCWFVGWFVCRCCVWLVRCSCVLLLLVVACWLSVGWLMVDGFCLVVVGCSRFGCWLLVVTCLVVRVCSLVGWLVGRLVGWLDVRLWFGLSCLPLLL